jgi:hypothetical protein
LNDLTDDELWEVTANTRIATDIGHEAIKRWLVPQETNPEVDPDDIDGGGLRELRSRAKILPKDEVEEDDIEDLYRNAPYFDGAGRFLHDYNGVRYLIDSVDEETLDDDDIS